MQESLDTLEKRVRERDLGKVTVDELLNKRSKPEGLRDYLGMRVLQKKTQDGKLRHEFLPDSLMYSLMLEFYNRTSNQEFIAMLPFPSPLLKDAYQKMNPNVQL